ncbi:MAG TPA: alpha/beta hydrolase, partial [Thermoanaerobaculia bacterium]|nr:alpha/beta hydrolase [Thermoanaerobaculia bacterium]
MTERLPVVLLPGMDGTGDLFTAFVRVAPPQYEPIVIRLSARASYDELKAEVAPKLPVGRPFVILGESFSGPLALRLAASSSDVRAVIFSNSFVCSPGKPMLRFLPWRVLFSVG